MAGAGEVELEGVAFFVVDCELFAEVACIVSVLADLQCSEELREVLPEHDEHSIIILLIPIPVPHILRHPRPVLPILLRKAPPLETAIRISQLDQLLIPLLILNQI